MKPVVEEAKELHSHREVKVKGWFSEKQKKWYRQTISNIQNGTIVEVGVYGGVSVLSVIDICIKNNNTIYAIDPWEKLETLTDQKVDEKTIKNAQERAKSLRLNLEKIIDKYQYHNHLKLICDFSPQASNNFEDSSLDLVFIDGNHTYDAVVKDINGWWKKVKPGKMLSGHDYDVKKFGVKKAVDEFVKENNLKLNLPECRNIWQLSELPRR